MIIETTVKENVEVKAPSFYKSKSENVLEMIALINEQTCAYITRTDLTSSVRNTHPRFMRQEIGMAFRDWVEIPEEEFMLAYNTTLLSLSLEPKETTSAGDTIDDLTNIHFK